MGQTRMAPPSTVSSEPVEGAAGYLPVKSNAEKNPMKKTCRIAFWAAVFVVLECVTTAQTTVAPSAFSLGATMDETYKVFGAPSQWYAYSAGSAHFLNSSIERDAALQVYGVRAVGDVYMRQTSANLYRIKVAWLPDETASRLRPTMRVRWLTKDVDKPAPVATILGDLPEAAEICKTGCDLYGVADGDFQVSGSYVLALPSNPSPAQLQTGLLLATNFEGGGVHEAWCIGIMLALKKSGGIWGGGELPNWQGEIASVTISTINPPAVPHDPQPPKKGKRPQERRSGGQTPPVKLGTWIPGSR